MSESKEPNKFYYSTYSSDIYAEAQHGNKDSVERKEDGKYIKSSKRHWSLNIILNTRLIIIIVSVVIGATVFSSVANNDPAPERFQVAQVIAPPSIFDIRELQIPSIGSVVNKRVIFENFIANLKSTKVAKRFTDDNGFHSKLLIKRDSKSFESTDSIKISVISKKPVIATQWLKGFLAFSASQTIADFVNKTERKIDDQRDKISLEIDEVYRENSEDNRVLEDKIKRFNSAIQKAKRKGVINAISVNDIPEEQRFGDLLYLRGYWILEADLKKLKISIKRQQVDVSEHQKELKKLGRLLPNTDNLKAFYLEKDLGTVDLNSKASKQLVWNIMGGILGLVLGLIISFPFRRKKSH